MPDLIYRCTYLSGGGTVYNDGFWRRKQTLKTIKLEKISEDPIGSTGVYAMHEVGTVKKIGTRTQNPLFEYPDNTFTVYFSQGGTPYFFEPVTQ